MAFCHLYLSKHQRDTSNLNDTLVEVSKDLLKRATTCNVCGAQLAKYQIMSLTSVVFCKVFTEER